MKQQTEKKVTIKCIAEELGISFSTVAKSLTGDPKIKKETRELVTTKAKEMGYSINMLARGLRTSSMKTIAVIFNDIENPVLTYIFKTISIFMAKYGYTTLFADSQFDATTEKSLIRSVLSRLPDFVVIAPATTDKQNVKILLSSIKNVIVLDSIPEDSDRHFVDVDYKYGGYISACNLLSNGHRDILVITEPLIYPYSTYYRDGINKAFDEYGIDFDDSCLRFAHSSLESACNIVLDLWDKDNKKFRVPLTAVMCFSDNFALGVYKAASLLGLSIPADISVIGFDNNDICEFTSPPLTTVHLPKERMAQVCIEIMESILVRRDEKEFRFSLAPHFVERNSVRRKS